ncbi:O-antigen translocase [Bacillus mobilis]|uniref:O-antigen translocase n=1 Tax=Bacillus mobilis TaxID=2026190 RepID=UPI0022E96BFC|nr:O-antigen translocase [Bacillus mobilis]
MNLLKTSFLSGIATIIKMASNLVINKIIAIYIGPSGIALIGQFQNVLNTLVILGSGGINAGVTKYIAESSDSKEAQKHYITTSLIITLLCSIVVGIGTFLLKDWLAFVVLSKVEYNWIFIVLSISIIFISLNNYLLALLNGLKEIKIYIAINILGSIVSLCVTTILTIKFETSGALLSMVLVQSIVLIITILFFMKKRFLRDIRLDLGINKSIYNNFFEYSLMAIVSIICVPITQLLIRNMVISEISLQAAGYWEAINKISAMYLLVVTTALSTYYLPRLSEIKKIKELKEEIIKSYKVIIPFAIISISCIYLFRDLIISILFTKEFYAMRDLFLYQLLGDFFKMCTWVLGFVLVARAKTKAFIFIEILSSFLYIGFSKFFIRHFEVAGVTMAYMVMYFILSIVMVKVYYLSIKEIKE